MVEDPILPSFVLGKKKKTDISIDKNHLFVI